MERVPIKSDPKLFDAAVAKIQILLADAFPWLDHSFGICEKLTDTKDGKKFNSANMYIGKGSYAQIMPCSELGNFSFFILRDPQERSKKDKNLIKAPFSLIIWYDTRNVSLATDERNREAIKEQILNLLNPHAFAWLNITKTYESPDKIFSDFSYDYTNNQFLMSPYAGLRLDGEMLVRLSCRNTPIIPDRGYSKSEIDAMMLRKADKDEVGDLNDLETEDKSSIVEAINEVNAKSGGGEKEWKLVADYEKSTAAEDTFNTFADGTPISAKEVVMYCIWNVAHSANRTGYLKIPLEQQGTRVLFGAISYATTSAKGMSMIKIDTTKPITEAVIVNNNSRATAAATSRTTNFGSAAAGYSGQAPFLSEEIKSIIVNPNALDNTTRIVIYAR